MCIELFKESKIKTNKFSSEWQKKSLFVFCYMRISDL